MANGTASARLVLLQDTGAGRGMALAPGVSLRCRGGVRGCDARRRTRGGRGTPPPRRGAALVSALGSGSAAAAGLLFLGKARRRVALVALVHS
jgi:hypothetical protein